MDPVSGDRARSRGLFSMALAAATLLAGAGAGAAHEFTAAILAVGEGREEMLAETVRGFLLAADERDGHAAETSDGHLGGVDVQVLPLPREAAGRVEGLVGAPQEPPEVVVVIGPEAEAAAAMASLDGKSIVFRPGALPDGWAEDTADGSFAARYRRAFGAEPGEAAAEGYNAARRLDLAIRPLDGVEPRAAVENALTGTGSGIAW